MVCNVVVVVGGGTLCFQSPGRSTPSEQWVKEEIRKRTGFPEQDQVVRLCKDTSSTSTEELLLIVRVNLRLEGGKGGFGALLRGQGAKASAKLKVSNDDCRDLSGRRIRHVKNEQRLAEWYAEQKSKEEQEAQKKEKKKKVQEPTFHVVEDPKFTAQIKEIEESITTSVELGLQEAKRLQLIKKQQQESNDQQSQQPKKKPKLLWNEFASDSEEEQPQQQGSKGGSTSSSTLSSTPNEEQPQVDSTDKSPEAVQDIPLSSVTTTTSSPPASEGLDLSAYSSAQELEALGLDALKLELQRRGLLCGGTLKDRAQRLFSVKGLSADEIDDSIKAKNVNIKKRKK